MKIEVGEIVSAKVESVRGYSVVLECGDDQVVVLAPEVRGSNQNAELEQIEVGSVRAVRILRRNEQTNQLVGSFILTAPASCQKT